MAGQLDDAAAIYHRLYAAKPRDSDVIFLFGVLCCDLGLFEPARRFLEEALAVAPVFPEARAQLARALNWLADLQVAAGKLTESRDSAIRFNSSVLRKMSLCEALPSVS